MNESVVRTESISICTARDDKQVSKRPNLLYVLHPSLIRNGPKQSIPEYVKGGKGFTLSGGRSAIFCSSTGLPYFLQRTSLLYKTTQLS